MGRVETKSRLEKRRFYFFQQLGHKGGEGVDRFIVFDVETPNFKNDRMSAIGVCVVEEGKIVWDYDTLINPETFFSRFNIALTGITPEAAAQAPAFPEVWRELRPVFDTGILIAHNAPFDMGVLAKCLGHYGIFWKHSAPYACTCRMARRCYPDLPNKKLDTLCGYLDISLDHHRAGSDARAAALILIDELARGMDIRDFKSQYYLPPVGEDSLA